MNIVVPWFLLATLTAPQDAAQQVSDPVNPPAIESPSSSPAPKHPADPMTASMIRAAFAPPPQVPAPGTPLRLCDGCPARRLGTAFLQATYINIFYGLANLGRGQATARITPSTWWTNMKRGWEWDLDDFVVNQIGHPYQGNNYFTAGRANGLNFWESAGLTAFGSGTWEYFGETNQASLNDFINTTLGGIALGEMFHRTAWLLRDTHGTGRSRLMREIAATAIDPITGVNRFISDDSSRIVDKPAEFVPTSLGALGAAGVTWRGTDTRAVNGSGEAFLQMDLLYGDVTQGRSQEPYDAFAVRLELGGGSPLSEATVRGRLVGRPVHGGGLQVAIFQGYQFQHNDAYRFGAQSMEVNLGGTAKMSTHWSMWTSGFGGVTVLGAVDSPVPEGAVGLPEGDANAPQGVSTGPRQYDYGPGSNAGGWLHLRRDGKPIVTFAYEVHHVHVLDGVRANHVLQRARVNLLLPVRGRLGFGVAGEFFDRRTYYKQPELQDAQFHYPQLRAFFTWSTQ